MKKNFSKFFKELLICLVILVVAVLLAIVLFKVLFGDIGNSWADFLTNLVCVPAPLSTAFPVLML